MRHGPGDGGHRGAGPGRIPGAPATSIASLPQRRAPVLKLHSNWNQTLTFPNHLQKRMCGNDGELWRHSAERGAQIQLAPRAFQPSSSDLSRPRVSAHEARGSPALPRAGLRQASAHEALDCSV